MDRESTIRCIASLGVGFAVSTGNPIGITAALAMPALAMWQNNRRAASYSALCYYAGASWPVILAARNFFGASAGLVEGTAAWFFAAILLGMPWTLAWTRRRTQFLWRVPLALAATVVPPLGLIGWASPLTAGGFAFPATAWFGLIALVVLSTGLCMKSFIFYTGFAAAVLAILAHISYPGGPLPPDGWEAVSTHFGAIAHGVLDPIREYRAAQWIQDKARSSHARVLVFPEMVVPRWTAATDLFWQQTLAKLSASGETILVGAGLPENTQKSGTWNAALASYDFRAAIAALRSDKIPVRGHARRLDGPEELDFDAYRNAILIRGAHHDVFVQRIPVPFGMWHPFKPGGVPLRLLGPSVIHIGNQRAAILICYEQLLTWPVLVSMMHHPTLIVAVANDYWVEDTSIPRSQGNSVRAWARLFGIPVLSAANK